MTLVRQAGGHFRDVRVVPASLRALVDGFGSARRFTRDEDVVSRPWMEPRIRQLAAWVKAIEDAGPKGRHGNNLKKLSAVAARELARRHPPPPGWPP